MHGPNLMPAAAPTFGSVAEPRAELGRRRGGRLGQEDTVDDVDDGVAGGDVSGGDLQRG